VRKKGGDGGKGGVGVMCSSLLGENHMGSFLNKNSKGGKTILKSPVEPLKVQNTRGEENC